MAQSVNKLEENLLIATLRKIYHIWRCLFYSDGIRFAHLLLASRNAAFIFYISLSENVASHFREIHLSGQICPIIFKIKLSSTSYESQWGYITGSLEESISQPSWGVIEGIHLINHEAICRARGLLAGWPLTAIW